MRWSLKRLGLAFLFVYIGVSCYTTYVLVQKRYLKKRDNRGQELKINSFQITDDDKWNPWGEEFEKEVPKLHVPNVGQGPEVNQRRNFLLRDTKDSNAQYTVEIWGKAAISLYLWEHILEGKLEAKMGGVWSYGSKQIDNIKFRFRTGPGVIPDKIPEETEHLLLVLNGREEEKIEFSQMWLDSIARLPYLKNVAVMLLGNEKCNNDWIKKYLSKNGGLVSFVFIVYDSPDVDDWNFYQWPLGVATYRKFPLVNSASLQLDNERKYLCNFLGTVYANSSRELLMKVIKDKQLEDVCLLKTRSKWWPSETEESLKNYITALSNSVLTLNPVGKNTECYRVYEAMSYGSIPVVEDIMTPGNCGTRQASHNTPLRLLKDNNAPVIFIKNWKDLPEIINKYRTMKSEDLVKNRKNVVDWYEKFIHKMRDKLVQTLQLRFFNA